MIELSGLLFVMTAIFGYVGFTRGWNREIIATAGVILGIFALFQFDDLIRNRLLGEIPRDQVFWIQAFVFVGIVFFAYQTRAEIGGSNRDAQQTRLLGGLVGLFNGYLVWGTLWYFLDVNGYPLFPYITAPEAGSANAATIESFAAFIQGGAAGNGEPLTLAVIVLFVIVLIVI